MQRTLDLLTDNGVSVVFKSNIHQKFAVMDQKVVWYGSINLLSYGSAQESIMRIESSNIANELMKSIEPKFPCYCNEAGGVTPNLVYRSICRFVVSPICSR
jgi:phosphatidylserine/phosphatidylglycerophosphate/cardiolipin synthase-like enzyme